MASVKEAAARVRRLAQLEDRVAALEAEVQECRQVNLRLAELTDVVAELLLPVAQRDEERIAELLQRYHESVGVPPS
jgi:flagellar biosynthesis/type III secretory pathway chaperone